MNTPGQANSSIDETLGDGSSDEEPSMEEILSSIRRIISDDDEDDVSAEIPAEAAAEPTPTPAPSPEPESSSEDVLELTEVFDQADETPEVAAPAPEPVPEPASEEKPALSATMDVEDDEIDFEETAVEAPQPTPVTEPSPASAPFAPSDTQLLSADTELASSAAFSKLAETLLSRSQETRTVEDLIQEMLKPMLKTWLDENLPDTVERLVREEIERVARRR